MAVKCVGSVVEPKCSFKGGNLDFKDIAICKPETRQFSIKNNTRAPAIYCVEESTIPEFVEVTPSKGKIGPDDSKDINVKIFCKDVRTIKVKQWVLSIIFLINLFQTNNNNNSNNNKDNNNNHNNNSNKIFKFLNLIG